MSKDLRRYSRRSVQCAIPGGSGCIATAGGTVIGGRRRSVWSCHWEVRWGAPARSTSLPAPPYGTNHSSTWRCGVKRHVPSRMRECRQQGHDCWHHRSSSHDWDGRLSVLRAPTSASTVAQPEAKYREGWDKKKAGDCTAKGVTGIVPVFAGVVWSGWGHDP